MCRAIQAALTLAVLLAAPCTALAQKEPPQTKELKDAEKFVASAMLTTDTAQRRSRLEHALSSLQPAMVKNADNARVWLTAGQVYAGLGDFPRADTAFTKAQQLYPDYAQEVASQRLGAWAAAFNRGVELMDARNYDEARLRLEQAETMVGNRPESKLNLAALYANAGQTDKAEAMFRSALDVLKSPARDSLKPDDAAQWKRYAEIATINLAQMAAQRGVDAFEAEKYDDAIAAFHDAYALNPLARDYSYNLAQSLYAKARALETKRAELLDQEKAARAKKDLATAKARADEAKRLAEPLAASYAELEPLVMKTREMDPNNEDLFLLLMRAYRVRGELSPDASGRTTFLKRADDLLREHQALEAEITGINITPGNETATIKGAVRNLKLTPGTPVKLRLTLLSLAGETIGEQEVVVTAPAAQESAPFETTTKLTGEVAAWKYALIK